MSMKSGGDRKQGAIWQDGGGKGIFLIRLKNLKHYNLEEIMGRIRKGERQQWKELNDKHPGGMDGMR